MSVRPVATPEEPGYPVARRLVRGLFLAAAVTATSLGGCGPAVDPVVIDGALDSGDLDAAACDGDGGEACLDAAAGATSRAARTDPAAPPRR